MSCENDRGRKGSMKGKRAKYKEESNTKKIEGRRQKARINEVFFVSPVVVIGRHEVPMGTIIGLCGKSLCLCRRAHVCTCACVSKEGP